MHQRWPAFDEKKPRAHGEHCRSAKFVAYMLSYVPGGQSVDTVPQNRSEIAVGANISICADVQLVGTRFEGNGHDGVLCDSHLGETDDELEWLSWPCTS